jgi:diamine N-acetyltransferase
MTVIRKVVTDTEIRVVSRLAHEIWVEHYTPVIGSAQVAYMLERYQSEIAIAAQIAAGYEYYLAYEEKQAAGYTSVIVHREEASLMLSKIYVLKSLRGSGVGTALMEFCESLCRERNLTYIWLTVNKYNSKSILWYEKMGFHNAGSLVQDIGHGFVMDDFRMEKQIS